MTNKSPEVGKIYKRRNCESEVEIIAIKDEEIIYWYEYKTVDNMPVSGFWNYFEEIPEKQEEKSDIKFNGASNPYEADPALRPKDKVVPIKQADSKDVADINVGELKEKPKCKKCDRRCEDYINEFCSPECWTAFCYEKKEKPASIWKDVSELPKFYSPLAYIKFDSDIISLGRIKKGRIFDIMGDHEYPLNIIKAYCELTDFIQDYERLKETVEKLEEGK